MKKIRQYFFIILLFVATLVLGYNYFYRPFEVSQAEIEFQELKDSLPELDTKKTKVDIFAELTTEEKIRLMISTPVVIQEEDLNYEKSGFYTLFGEQISFINAKESIELLKKNMINDLIPWIAVDHEGGSVQRLSGEGFAKLDSWFNVCELDQDERKAVLKQTAVELKDVGVDIVLAPVLDVGNNQNLGDRVCSKDSYPVVADRSMDFTTTFTSIGILPVLKHFPGIGLTKNDLHKSFDYINVLENDVKLYKYVIDQNEKIGVMTSHVGVATQDKDIPCSVSPFCVSELNKAYPNVLVFTDALEMKSAAYDMNNPKVNKSLEQVSKAAVLAGNDVLIYGPTVQNDEIIKIVLELVDEYENSIEFKTSVDQSVLKIIEYKYEK